LTKIYKNYAGKSMPQLYTSPGGKSFETGIVPVARYNHPLSSVLFKNSSHGLSNQNTAFSYFRY